MRVRSGCVYGFHPLDPRRDYHVRLRITTNLRAIISRNRASCTCGRTKGGGLSTYLSRLLGETRIRGPKAVHHPGKQHFSKVRLHTPLEAPRRESPRPETSDIRRIPAD